MAFVLISPVGLSPCLALGRYAWPRGVFTTLTIFVGYFSLLPFGEFWQAVLAHLQRYLALTPRCKVAVLVSLVWI